MNKAYRILGILQEYAPNAAAQEKCAEIYRKAEEDGADTALVMAQALLDGLKFSNWPWTKY